LTICKINAAQVNGHAQIIPVFISSKEATLPRDKYVKHSATAKERLTDYSKPTENGCINFTGSKNWFGHGEITYRGKKYRAHRLAYIEYIGPIPEGMVICHKCDNPSCINPNHLFAGTQADNLRDAINKKRMKAPNPRGVKHGLAKLTDEKVIAIRKDQRTQRAIAADYGIHQTTVKNIKLNRTWKHVGA
jgi:hypothetical protein